LKTEHFALVSRTRKRQNTKGRARHSVSEAEEQNGLNGFAEIAPELLAEQNLDQV
jgi:hypothetical protein